MTHFCAKCGNEADGTLFVGDRWVCSPWCGSEKDGIVDVEGLRQAAISDALNRGLVVPPPRLGPRQWRYDDAERPRGRCYDCDRPYGEQGFEDLLIADEAWEQINPTHHAGAGLLCPSCIVGRLNAVGASRVASRWMSGPLCVSDERGTA